MSNSNDLLPEFPPAFCAGKDNSEILVAIRAGLEESPQTVNLIAASLRSCAGGLRMGQSGPALETLGQAVGNLTLLAELVSGIRTGLARLNLVGAPLASWDACAGTFKGVVDTLERRDWVLLADLIEYELCPALDETEKEMAALRERLNCIGR
jgi:hypothetical protein